MSTDLDKLLAQDIELPPAETRAVLAKLDAALLDLGSYGLAQSSRATLDQLDALTISLHNARLVRLERLTQTIRTQVAEYQAKTPNFDPAEYGRVMAEAGVLSRRIAAKLGEMSVETPTLQDNGSSAKGGKTLSLQNRGQVEKGVETPPLQEIASDGRGEVSSPNSVKDTATLRELAGEVRSVYLEVNTLEVQCLGAEGWRSDTGYAGVTLYLYELAAGRWLTLSNLQPLLYGYYDNLLHQLYDKRPSLEGRPLSALAHAAFTLLQPKVNRAGRLSSSEATRAILKEQELPLSHPAFDRTRAADWQRLAESLDDAVSPETSPVWLLEPAHYSPPIFDEISRRWQMGLLDRAGRWLTLEIESLPHTRSAISRLERFYERSAPPDYLLAQVWPANGKLFARPLSAGWKGGVLLSGPEGPRLVNLCHLNLETAEVL
jgi:hypothetical protein